jgi:hypothetical protein
MNKPTPDSYIAVAHVETDDSGTKVEPELQPAQQRGAMTVPLNLGVAQPHGPPLITKYNVGVQLAHYTRDTTAGGLADQLFRVCENCRHFNDVRLHEGDNVAGKELELAEKLIELNYSRGPNEAMAMAKRFGVCEARHMLAHPLTEACPMFKTRRFDKRAFEKRDEILNAAAGGAKITVSGKGK